MPRFLISFFTESLLNRMAYLGDLRNTTLETLQPDGESQLLTCDPAR